jgi:transcriptional regulator with XRE-family HTH domain
MKTAELAQRAKASGAVIDQLIKADPRSVEEIAKAFGYPVPTLKKIWEGKSNLQYAKLAKLAEVLKTTPNVILGFDEPRNQDILRGALEGVARALDRSKGEAAEFANRF